MHCFARLRTCFVLPVLLVCSCVQAQNTLRFFEDFSDTTANLWYAVNDQYGLIELRKEKYFVDSKITGYQVSVPEVHVDAKKPFEFSVGVTCDSCPTRNGIGIGWGESPNENVSTFVVAPDGSISFYVETKAGPEWIIPSTYNPAVKLYGTNRLWVKSTGKMISLFVNDTLVYSGKKGLWSKNFYLRMYDRNKAVFDDLEIVYEQ